MFDEARFGRPAVLTAAVAKNFCWWSEGGVRSTQCGLHRTMGWLEVWFRFKRAMYISHLLGPTDRIALGHIPQPHCQANRIYSPQKKKKHDNKCLITTEPNRRRPR